MNHEHNLATLREGIHARGQRERATTDRDFVMLSAAREREAAAFVTATSEDTTQPIRVVDLR